MIRRRLKLSAFGLIIALAPLFATCTLTPTNTGAVYGYVRDARTLAPMVGAFVECEDEWVETGADGSYYLNGITEGWRSIHAEASGYSDYSDAVNVSGDTKCDIQMDVAVGVSHVYGVVSHPGMGPVPGANVVIGDRSCMTDSSGSYEFWNVLRSNERMEVSCEGFWAIEVALELEDDHHEIDVGIKRRATVSLPVLADATVRSDLPETALGYETTLDLIHNEEYHFRFYAAFDLTMHHPIAAPEHALIVEATVELYNLWPSGDTDEGVPIHTGIVHEIWYEKTTSWNNAPAYAVGTLADWDYESRVYSIDIAYAVREWIDGAHGNFGVIIDTPLNEQATRFSFASLEHPEESWRPRLVLDYAW